MMCTWSGNIANDIILHHILPACSYIASRITDIYLLSIITGSAQFSMTALYRLSGISSLGGRLYLVANVIITISLSFGFMISANSTFRSKASSPATAGSEIRLFPFFILLSKLFSFLPFIADLSHKDNLVISTDSALRSTQYILFCRIDLYILSSSNRPPSIWPILLFSVYK